MRVSRQEWKKPERNDWAAEDSRLHFASNGCHWLKSRTQGVKPENRESGCFPVFQKIWHKFGMDEQESGFVPDDTFQPAGDGLHRCCRDTGSLQQSPGRCLRQVRNLPMAWETGFWCAQIKISAIRPGRDVRKFVDDQAEAVFPIRQMQPIALLQFVAGKA